MFFNDISQNGASLLRELKLPAISQVGIVVENLQKAAAYYGALFNIKTWYIPNVKSDEVSYRGKPLRQKLDFTIGYSGALQIELIKQECDDENVYNAVLGRGKYGFHHLGVIVGGINKKIEMMKAAGLQPLQTGIIHTGAGVTKYAYFDTLNEAGFIIELIESRAFGINTGMPRWLMSSGLATGDTKKLT